jgi:bifunctional N-acetylglucosamine-1-phosphate-uridyltransferase/glucosamine-1-phosphate-acetyltransferase GlmU-like protein
LTKHINISSLRNLDWFFPGISADYEGLFKEDSEVWTALDRLNKYIRKIIRPNLEETIVPGIPLSAHLVLLPRGWMRDGFEVVCNESTKGNLEVRVNGEPVPQASLVCAGAVFTDDRIQIGKGVFIESGAMIKGPSIIGDYTLIKQGAYMRGDCLIGKNCVIGHTTEVKHSVFLDGSKAGHFAYIGDSILGRDVNLGAGTKLANLRFASGNVSIRIEGSLIDTGRRKLGAILGNKAQTGCNSVTNPGTLVGPDSIIAPNTTVRPGLYAPCSVIR